MVLRIMCFLGVAGLWGTITQAEIARLGAWGVEYDFRLQGTYGRKQAPYRAYYTLNGGHLQCSNAFLSFAWFTHNAGTNTVRGRLAMMSMEGTQYALNGGRLNADTVLLDPVGNPCVFGHSGGAHYVNRLILQAYPGRTSYHSIYAFDFGYLEARDVVLLDKVLFQHTGGTLRHMGLLTMAGGTWQAKPGAQVLGQLLVARSAQSSNSSLSLPSSPCAVRFQASRGQPWETNASLFIRNWAGSLTGRGQHQVIFGRAAGGITREQLAQIRFVNVIGQLPGQYSATELANGEIVPDIKAEAPPALHVTKLSDRMILTWPVGYTLQSATNADGPFQDVLKQFQTVPNDSGYAGVYFNSADRLRLFRLRK